MFQGFSQETVDFMWGIRFNNEKPWFEAHKAQYQNSFLLPMRELAAQCQTAVNKEIEDPKLNLHVARIYRDARRLFGRGPYKDNLWFTLFRGDQSTPHEHPALWFGLSPDGWDCGMGFWDATPDIMAKFRARIDKNPKEMLALDKQFQKQSYFQLAGTPFKRPKMPVDQPLARWYNMRTVALEHDEPLDEILYSPALADQVIQGFLTLLPFYTFFDSLWADPEPSKQ